MGNTLKAIKTQLLMSKAEIRDRSKRIKGKVREEIGKLRNNKTWQVQGKIEQIEGKVRETVGRTVRKTKMQL